MITFFTTTKTFLGKNMVNQVNAVKSWVIGNKYNCEAIIFQKSNGIGILENLPRITIVGEAEVNENGVPYINEMIYRVSALAKNKIVCFLNADIIIDNFFIEALIDIHKKAKTGYLVAGQRIDTAFNFLIDFDDPGWYQNLLDKTGSSSSVHLPYGSDVFAFPKGQYIAGTLPDLLVGRPGWDNYMIYDARKKGFKLIDLSSTYMVLHQSHDYNHKSGLEEIRKQDDNHNYKFLPVGEKYMYVLDYCNYKYISGRIKKTYHNYQFDKYYYLECTWGKASFFKKVMLKMEIFLFRKLHSIKKI